MEHDDGGQGTRDRPRHVLRIVASHFPGLGAGRRAAAGGLVVGPGLTWWLSRHAVAGLTADLQYRLLVGEAVEHVVTCAAGLAFRL